MTFETGHLSRVLGLRLRDGREVVVKVRPWQERLVTCVAVQGVLAGLGFPCPRPLAGPDRIGPHPVQAVHAEQLLPGGQMMPPGGDAAGMFAALLADLVALTPYVAATQLASLRACSPPWVGWDHIGEQLWPARDTPGRALHEQPGPDWVDEVAVAARALLLSASDLPLVLGHGDWESQNLRWIDRRPGAVHDWDSLVAQPEPAVVGAAAAVWPAGAASRHAATVQESEAFLDAYQHAAGRTWNDRDRRLAWASGLWLRTYNAKRTPPTAAARNWTCSQTRSTNADDSPASDPRRLLPEHDRLTARAPGGGRTRLPGHFLIFHGSVAEADFWGGSLCGV